LRALAASGADVLEAPVHVYEPPTAYQASNIQAAGTRFKADAMYAGENRPRGARITYSVNPDAYRSVSIPAETDDRDDGAEQPAKAPDDVEIRILDGDEVIRTFEGPAVAGMNRVIWSMNRKGVRGPSRSAPRRNAPEPGGPQVLPGIYGVQVIFGADTTSTTVTVELDPRYEVDLTALRARHAMYRQYEAMVETAADMMTRVREAKEVISRVDRGLEDRDDDTATDLKKQGKTLSDSLDAFQDRYFGPQGKQGIYRPFDTVGGKVSGAGRYLFSSDRPPNTPEDWSMSAGRRALEEMLSEVNAFLSGPWSAYVAAVRSSDAFRVPDLLPLEMN